MSNHAALELNSLAKQPVEGMGLSNQHAFLSVQAIDIEAADRRRGSVSSDLYTMLYAHLAPDHLSEAVRLSPVSSDLFR